MATTPGTNTYWASDVRISMPMPSDQPRGTEMSGFVFTGGGLAHDISEADFMRLSTPDFHPGDSFPDLAYQDLDVETPASPSTIVEVF